MERKKRNGYENNVLTTPNKKLKNKLDYDFVL